MKAKLLCGMFLLIAVTAYAADSCGNWMWQKPGLYWQLCVDDKGVQHCYYADDDKGTNQRPAPCN
jgi:hypothetical protein